jgi:periplasmic protein TonB
MNNEMRKDMPRYQSAYDAVRSVPFGDATSQTRSRAGGLKRSNPMTPERAAVPLSTGDERGAFPSEDMEMSRGERARRRAIRRFVALGIVALIHVVLLYWLAMGFLTRPAELVPPAIEATIITEVRPPEPAPPQPTVELQPPQAIYVPTPLVNVDVPANPDALRATDIPPLPQSKPTTAPPQSKTVRVPVRVAASFVHPVDLSKYYPSESRRAAEQGVVTLRVCVNTDGRYDGRPVITGSSGYPRLDEAGVDMVLDNKMRPGTLDGVPVHSCESLAVQFQMDH